MCAERKNGVPTSHLPVLISFQIKVSLTLSDEINVNTNIAIQAKSFTFAAPKQKDKKNIL
jgi:hypothetical protein